MRGHAHSAEASHCARSSSRVGAKHNTKRAACWSVVPCSRCLGIGFERFRMEPWTSRPSSEQGAAARRPVQNEIILLCINTLTPSPPRRFAWRPIRPSRPRAGRRRRPRARPDPPDASPGPPKHKVELFSCNFHRILLVFRAERPWRPGLQSAVVGWSVR